MNSNLVLLCLAMRLLIIMLSFISMAMTQRECEPLIDHRCDGVIGKKFCCSDKNGFVTCQEEVIGNRRWNFRWMGLIYLKTVMLSGVLSYEV